MEKRANISYILSFCCQKFLHSNIFLLFLFFCSLWTTTMVFCYCFISFFSRRLVFFFSDISLNISWIDTVVELTKQKRRNTKRDNHLNRSSRDIVFFWKLTSAFIPHFCFVIDKRSFLFQISLWTLRFVFLNFFFEWYS